MLGQPVVEVPMDVPSLTKLLGRDPGVLLDMHQQEVQTVYRVLTNWAEQRQSSALRQITEWPLEYCDWTLKRFLSQFAYRRLYLHNLTKTEIWACQRYGLGTWKAFEMLRLNPLLLVPVPLDKCIDICRQLDFSIDSDQLTAGKVVRKIWKDQERGWAGTPDYQVRSEIAWHPGVLPLLLNQYGVVHDQETYYLPLTYQQERAVAQWLIEVVTRDTAEATGKKPPEKTGDGERTTTQPGENAIAPTKLHTTRPLHPLQEEAIRQALQRHVVVITGGAGTGKTTTVSQLVVNLHRERVAYAVVSPTGKATARLRQELRTIPELLKVTTKSNTALGAIGSTGLAASGESSTPTELRVSPTTIHHLLLVPPHHLDHIVVDEVSMVTIDLLAQLLNLFPDARYTLVGDVGQIQPIGWGTLLHQCLLSGTIPTYFLTADFRLYQTPGERNGLAENRDALAAFARGAPGVERYQFAITPNFQFIPVTLQEMQAYLLAFHQNGIRPTILSFYRSNLDILNSYCQQMYYGTEPGVVDSEGHAWRKGDRVMMLVNDSNINVYNGEEGHIITVTPAEVVVDFGGAGIHAYSTQVRSHEDSIDPEGVRLASKHRDTSYLSLSYAITVHKAQGSEFDFVLVYCNTPEPGQKVVNNYRPTGRGFVNIQLIYTAVSRAKRAAYVMGTLSVFSEGIKCTAGYRHDKLAKRLRSALPQVRIDLPEAPTLPVSESGEDDCPSYEDYM
jgi:hypothetical protein